MKFQGKVLIAFSMILFFSIHAFAQTKSKTPNYSKHPYWIDMIKDPNVNYFEAVKAYDEFWKDRKKPEQEDDIIGQKNRVPSNIDCLKHASNVKKQRDVNTH